MATSEIPQDDLCALCQEAPLEREVPSLQWDQIDWVESNDGDPLPLGMCNVCYGMAEARDRAGLIGRCHSEGMPDGEAARRVDIVLGSFQGTSQVS
ncbi:MAG TPA: hypothetical protein VJQ83_03445 [Tepidiformaceae bacterium]|nr:hypothetical protein [Tepidiformaceae bacterium]